MNNGNLVLWFDRGCGESVRLHTGHDDRTVFDLFGIVTRCQSYLIVFVKWILHIHWFEETVYEQTSEVEK